MVDLSLSLCCNSPTALSLNWLMKRFNGLAPLLPGGPVLLSYLGAFPYYVFQIPSRQAMGSLTGWISWGRRKGGALTQMCLPLSAYVFSQSSRWSPNRKWLHWRVTQKCQHWSPAREKNRKNHQKVSSPLESVRLHRIQTLRLVSIRFQVALLGKI